MSRITGSVSWNSQRIWIILTLVVPRYEVHTSHNLVQRKCCLMLKMYFQRDSLSATDASITPATICIPWNSQPFIPSGDGYFMARRPSLAMKRPQPKSLILSVTNPDPEQKIFRDVLFHTIFGWVKSDLLFHHRLFVHSDHFRCAKVEPFPIPSPFTSFGSYP